MKFGTSQDHLLDSSRQSRAGQRRRSPQPLTTFHLAAQQSEPTQRLLPAGGVWERKMEISAKWKSQVGVRRRGELTERRRLGEQNCIALSVPRGSSALGHRSPPARRDRKSVV